MTESELLDELAKAIDSPRAKGRLDRIREAFAEYTKFKQRKWWHFWKNEKGGPFWA